VLRSCGDARWARRLWRGPGRVDRSSHAAASPGHSRRKPGVTRVRHAVPRASKSSPARGRPSGRAAGPNLNIVNALPAAVPAVAVGTAGLRRHGDSQAGCRRAGRPRSTALLWGDYGHSQWTVSAALCRGAAPAGAYPCSWSPAAETGPAQSSSAKRGVTGRASFSGRHFAACSYAALSPREGGCPGGGHRRRFEVCHASAS
jgi:hypothetical protein